MRPIKPRKDTLRHSDNVIHNCTAGSPAGRKPYGDGNSIVVGSVTTAQGGLESRPQCEGSYELTLVKRKWRYAQCRKPNK